MTILGMTIPQIFEDVVAIRRRRLREWIDDHCNGLQAAFMDRCAKNNYLISQSELSGLLKKKSFGEKKARSIEIGAGMPAMHLDLAVTMSAADHMEAARKVQRIDRVSESPRNHFSPWPFSLIWPDDYNRLDVTQKNEVEDFILFKLTQIAKDPQSEHISPENNERTGTNS